MNRHQKPSLPPVRNPAYRRAFQLLDEAWARACERNAACHSPMQAERLKRARIALFGCAPE